MPPNYAVCADVIDIGSDIPQPTDEFLIDTNVWAFLVYSKMAIGPHPTIQRQVAAYSNYVRQTMSCGSRLRRCCLTFAELAHLIEKTEKEIYLATNSFLTTKEFRHNQPQERAGVVAEIQSAWLQVKAMAAPADALVNDTMTDALLVKIQNQALDGYDLFLLEAAASAGIMNIITDDGDYCCVPGIKVFTSNRRVLSEAQNNGRLIVR
ncbi:MAG TPA: hypothetical protein VGN86_03310 [Pyrinomonadaceae bacterium]|nr:hypothetical protein [Pyrinomonadaceae bacterium]